MLIKQLNKKLSNKSIRKKAALALLALALLMLLIACGKKTPPLAPIEKVKQRVEVTGFQRGNIVTLSWVMPARNAKEGNVSNINRVDVYRLAESPTSSLSLTEDEFASQSTLIKSLPITESDFALKQLTYQDSLEFAGQAVRLRYAIRFVNDSGQKAAFSNSLLIEPTAKVALPPSLSSVKESEDVIKLMWEAPKTNIDESEPANILGYNVYRKTDAAEIYKILNNQPLTKEQFSDSFFDFNTTYSYLVRTVSLGNNGQPIESQDSNVVTITPKDTFPPEAPSAITIAAAQNSLSIFFVANEEKDIAGYRIYRSTNQDVPKSDWQLLTKELLTTNTFQDTLIEPGKTYFYYIIAVDKAGNISPPSEVISETAP